MLSPLKHFTMARLRDPLSRREVADSRFAAEANPGLYRVPIRSPVSARVAISG